MASVLASTFAIAFLVAAGPEDDAQKLQGTWVMVRGETDGQALPPETVKSARLVIEGNRHTVTVGNDKMVGTHHLDSTTKPKSIDTRDTEGPFKGMTLHGIYRLRGDEFTVCFAGPDKRRPKKFTTEASEAVLLHTWKKEKP